MPNISHIDLILDTLKGKSSLATDANGKIIEGSGIGSIPAGSDTQIQFNDSGAFGADADLTWDKTTNLMTITGNIKFGLGANRTITTTDQTVNNTAGNDLSITTASGLGNGAGGDFSVQGGSGGATGAGGAIEIFSGDGGATSGAGGSLYMGAGSTTAGSDVGGVVDITAGSGGDTGDGGAISIVAGPGGSTSGDGGSVTIDSGTTTSGNGGDIIISTGLGIAHGRISLVGRASSGISEERYHLKSTPGTVVVSSGSTITSQRQHQFFKGTINGVAGGATETVTNAATVYIDAAPSGSNITITNPYSLWIDSGVSRFDGDGTHVLELPADATANGAAQVGRIPVKIGGSTFYIYYYGS